MKKYLLSTFAVLTALTMSTQANAQNSMMDHAMNHMYVRADVGYAMGMDNTDDTAFFGLGVGGKLNDYFRTELVGEYRPWSEEKFRSPTTHRRTDMHSFDVFMNVYGSYPIVDNMSLYATGGIGYAYNKTDKHHDVLKGEGKGNFAWNIGAGIEYMVTPCLGMDLGYRYTDLGTARAKEVATGRKIKEDVKYNDIKLGIKYYF